MGNFGAFLTFLFSYVTGYFRLCEREHIRLPDEATFCVIGNRLVISLYRQQSAFPEWRSEVMLPDTQRIREE